jgi:hypothetical protein
MENIKSYVQEKIKTVSSKLIELLKMPSVSADTAYLKMLLKHPRP